MDAAAERRILVERQEARRKRANAKRDRVREAHACPKCGAGLGHPCRHPDGVLRVHNHQERVDLTKTFQYDRDRLLEEGRRAYRKELTERFYSRTRKPNDTPREILEEGR